VGEKEGFVLFCGCDSFGKWKFLSLTDLATNLGSAWPADCGVSPTNLHEG
jgi:hypothetical protein